MPLEKLNTLLVLMHVLLGQIQGAKKRIFNISTHTERLFAMIMAIFSTYYRAEVLPLCLSSSMLLVLRSVDYLKLLGAM